MSERQQEKSTARTVGIGLCNIWIIMLVVSALMREWAYFGGVTVGALLGVAVALCAVADEDL